MLGLRVVFAVLLQHYASTSGTKARRVLEIFLQGIFSRNPEVLFIAEARLLDLLQREGVNGEPYQAAVTAVFLAAALDDLGLVVRPDLASENSERAPSMLLPDVGDVVLGSEV